MSGIETEFPNVTNVIREMTYLVHELEATRAELAAERERKGGVAWALKMDEPTLKSQFWCDNFGNVAIFKSEAKAKQWAIENGIDCLLNPVPYSIGDGADELKAAIERAEKAESEVAAWKEAANAMTEGVMWIQSPCELAAHVKGLETKLAALKASLAEVPPLDKRRVLATVAEMAYKAADFDFAKAVCLQMNVAEWKESKPYPLKD